MRWALQPFASYTARIVGTQAPVGIGIYDPDEISIVRADGFGQTMSLRGNVLAVGQSNGAYTFTRRASDPWGTWLRTVLRRPKAAGARFGTSVAVGSGYVVVGSMGYVLNGTNQFQMAKKKEKAQAYVYSAKNWAAAPRALSKPKAASADFGTAVAAYEDTVAVSDPTLGNIFVYTLKNGAWSAPQALLGAAVPGCCGSVALGADTLATEDSKNTLVFTRSNEAWARQGALDRRLGSFAQLQLSESGNTLGVGSAVYTRSIGAWTLLQNLTSSLGPGVESLYAVTALSGDDLLIDGANVMVEDPATWAFEANAWVRETSEGLYVKKARLGVPYPDVTDTQGYGVYGKVAAASGGLIAVAEPGLVGNTYLGPALGAIYLWNEALL